MRKKKNELSYTDLHVEKKHMCTRYTHIKTHVLICDGLSFPIAAIVSIAILLYVDPNTR